jgi:aldehyde dehydrogenase (NAD+)
MEIKMENITEDKINSILQEHGAYFETGEARDIDFRLRQLGILKKAIQKNEPKITKALFKDLHKSEFESYATEIGYVLDSIGYFMKNLRSWAKVKKVKTPYIHAGSKSYVYYEPYGTVLIIGPFNYPFQLVIEPLIGAIAAGNCVVIKPSEYTPNISKVISDLIKESFDESYIRMIEGGKEINSLLINSHFDYMFFTGSVPVGKIVMEAASKNLVPVTLELGGKSPCIIDKDANLDIAAKRVVWGKFLNAGQTCVAPDYLLVHRDVKNGFVEKMIHSIKEFYGEDPKLSPDFGRIVNERQITRLIGLIDNEKVIYGGEFDMENLYISPTIVDNVTWEDKVMEDEIFGPILPVIEYEDLENMIKIVNSRPKPLALYIFTENRDVEKKVIENISYGGGCVNDTMTHLATPFLPFGGVGPSGLGSYHGEESFKTFSHSKSVLKRSTRLDIKFLYPPYNRGKVNLLRRFFK